MPAENKTAIKKDTHILINIFFVLYAELHYTTARAQHLFDILI